MDMSLRIDRNLASHRVPLLYESPLRAPRPHIRPSEYGTIARLCSSSDRQKVRSELYASRSPLDFMLSKYTAIGSLS